MKITNGIVALLVIFTLSIPASSSLIPGRIVVKFKANSVLYTLWSTNNRTGNIAAFTSLIGAHISRGYISDATLTAVTKSERERRSSFRRSSTETITENLSRICVLECAVTIDCEMLARKLRSNPNVEYSEPLQRQEIIADPNDPEISRQYNIQTVQAIAAWDEIPTDSDPILIAIIDTGVDYNHEDLAPNIFTNAGESGIDTQGRDKRSNGIDDDSNGFIDDWHGWDFVAGATGNTQDNDPQPGNVHGTHVAGIAAAAVNNSIGIAGTIRNSRILPVKVSSDGSSISISNGYEGILYAATMGAKVINCSWGSTSPSNAEAEIIASAIALGSLIVGGAGNDGNKGPFYPAAYFGVVSVAATMRDDRVAPYSNYHRSVDICAPGSSIYSTLPGNLYGNQSGTSMASPCAAGVAALIRQKFPNFTAQQTAEQLKATADIIDTINPDYYGFIGRGRINAYRAVTDRNTRSLQVSRFKITDENNNGLYELGEKIEVYLTIRNVLSPVQNVKIVPQSPTDVKVNYMPTQIDAGNFLTLEEKEITEPIVFTIPNDTPDNYVMVTGLTFIDLNGVITTDYITINVNPTYRTMSANTITATFNSVGNIGYNDFPSNSQGDGFLYKGRGSLLFEGALMVGTSLEKISNSARSSFSTDQQDNSFQRMLPFNIKMPGIVSLQDGSTEFADLNQSADVGVSVKQTAYQFSGEGKNDFIIVAYDITNTSQTDFTTLHAGLFFDWDIGPSGQNNIARLDTKSGFGYAYCIDPDTLPAIAVELLTPQKLNFFAIDNNGIGGSNPGIYNGFTRNAKWQTLSSGIGRLSSSITDVSMVIGAGPMLLSMGETVRVAFALGASDRKEILSDVMKKAKETAAEHSIAKGFEYTPLPDVPIFAVYPNILAEGASTAEFRIIENSLVHIDVVNVLGMVVAEVYHNSPIAGTYKRQIPIENLISGMYYVRFQSGNTYTMLPLLVFR